MKATTILTLTVVWALSGLGSHATAGVLAPSKASQLVTLRSSGSLCSVIGSSPGNIAIDESHTSSGTIVPFSTPPAKQVLVITDVEFLTGGLTPGSGINFVLVRVPPAGGSSGVVTSMVSTGEASGFASATAAMPNGSVVQPGTLLCLCANGAGGCNANSNVTIHGYFAPNK